jgi:hypothetical protein
VPAAKVSFFVRQTLVKEEFQMKRCPICEKTFDDNLRFCQADGTALVDAVEDVDPFKTMVARPEDIAAAIPPASPETPTKPESTSETDSPGDLLELPSDDDANKTQVVSEEELRAEMAKADHQVVDVPPIADGAEPPPASFEEPAIVEEHSLTTPPIPSPFGDVIPKDEPPAPEPAEFSAPQEPVSPLATPFAEPTPEHETPHNPFEHSAPIGGPPRAQSAVDSPGGQKPVMQNHEFGQGGQQFSPPPAAAAGGQSQTLAIISLVVGILSLCCGYTFIVPIIAIVLGFMARGKANNDPANYGGAGLALGGIITGALALLLGIVLIILNVVMGLGGAMMQGF